jgi:hypothetical protein
VFYQTLLIQCSIPNFFGDLTFSSCLPRLGVPLHRYGHPSLPATAAPPLHLTTVSHPLLASYRRTTSTPLRIPSSTRSPALPPYRRPVGCATTYHKRLDAPRSARLPPPKPPVSAHPVSRLPHVQPLRPSLSRSLPPASATVSPPSCQSVPHVHQAQTSA